MPKMYMVLEGTKFECFVTDRFVHVQHAVESVEMKPFETSAQALQRVYPGCEIYVGNLRVNAPGMREWLA